MTDRERSARIRQAWDDAADLYDRYFVPRFMPWVAAGVRAVVETELPDGPILVPCCGTFPEHRALAAAFPKRWIVGLDLSDGMVQRARENIGQLPYVEARQADAAQLDDQWTNRCAGNVSVFGLQQLPFPLGALRNWTAALRVGGVLSVVYWPPTTEDMGPFALFRQVTRGSTADQPGFTPEQVATSAASAGGTVVTDVTLSFPMRHPDPETFWHAHTHGGPGRALAISRGDADMGRLRRRFLTAAPKGPWQHRPTARHLVISR